MNFFKPTVVVFIALFFFITSLVGCKKDEKKKPSQQQTAAIKESPVSTSPTIEGPESQPDSSHSADSYSDKEINLKLYSHRMNKMADSGFSILNLMRERWAKSYHSPVFSEGMPTCSDFSGCDWSEGVGNIVTSSGTCVATLIDKDLIITAAHCLPGRQIGSKLIGDFKLPSLKVNKQRNVGQESLSLGNVLAMSDEARDGVDFAIIRLLGEARMHRPLELSREGFDHQKKYMTIGVDLVQDSPNFQKWNIRESCYSSFTNVMMPEFNHSKNKIVYLGDCPIGAGNSGAPILTQDRKVVGIVRGHPPQEKVSFYRSFLIGMGFMKTKKSSFSTAATNIACVPDVVQGKSLVTEECDKNYFTKDEKSMRRSVKFVLSDKIQEEISRIEEEKDGRLVEIKNSNPLLSLMKIFIPNCVRYEKLPTVKGDKFQVSAVYAPLIDHRFEITETLSKPNIAMLTYKKINESDSSYQVKYDFEEGLTLYKGYVPECNQ